LAVEKAEGREVEQGSDKVRDSACYVESGLITFLFGLRNWAAQPAGELAQKHGKWCRSGTKVRVVTGGPAPFGPWQRDKCQQTNTEKKKKETRPRGAGSRTLRGNKPKRRDQGSHSSGGGDGVKVKGTGKGTYIKSE